MAGGGGGVCHHAGVYVGLGQHVGTSGTAGGGARSQDGRRTGDARDLGIRHRERRERDIAGVGDLECVGNGIARVGTIAIEVGDCARALHQANGGRLIGGDGDGIGGRGHGSIAGAARGTGEVGDAARVHIGLDDGVAAGAGDAGGGRQDAARQGRTADPGNAVITHGDWLGQRDVANVGHQIGIGKNIARGRIACGCRGLVEAEGRSARRAGDNGRIRV